MFRTVGKWFPIALVALGVAACSDSPVTLPDAPTATSIGGSVAEIRLVVGSSTAFPAQVLDQNGQVLPNVQLAYSSDNGAVATVDANGNVRAVAPGTANITASFGSVKATTKITVIADETGRAASIGGSVAEIRLLAGTSTAFPAQVLDRNGQVLQNARLTYSSDNPAVATVDANGNVRAVAPGTANITASFGNVQATTKITVTANETNFIASVNVEADSVVTDVNAQQAATVLVRSVTRGGDADACPTFTITLSDPSVASVNQTGCNTLNVSGRFPGRTTVTVSAEGASDTFQVIVARNDQRANFVNFTGTVQANSTTPYSVRVLDEAGNPVAGRTVNFDVTNGSLSATSVVTDANGVATVQFTAPTNLGTSGSSATISFAATLGNGRVANGSGSIFIAPAPAASVTLYRYNNTTGRFEAITGTSVTAPIGSTVFIGANSRDQFGNQRQANAFAPTGATSDNFEFAVNPTTARACPTDQNLNDGMVQAEYTCVRLATAGTVTVNATVGGVSRAVSVVFGS